ncbi:MAG: Na+/H+ antiporter NhaA [Byssovorax sp.]
MSRPATPPVLDAPPGALSPARRALQRVTGPIERFLHVEAASGILLLTAALVALVWANSPLRSSYEHLWHTPISIGAGGFSASKPLHFWINDALMVVFFFVVGLEIRREMHDGELSDVKRATLPIAAALGGMLVPAAIFFAVNHGAPAKRGWGVPMATDIAFAVGVLALLGKRVPAAVRVLLLALAIIDDIGAIIVIAVFYSSSFSWTGVAIAGLGLGGVGLLRSVGVRSTAAYVIPGVVLWAGILVTGVHPTIAGVILGLLTPAKAWFGERGFLATVDDAIDEVRRRHVAGHDARDLLDALARIEQAQREAVPPVVRLEAALHPWVAYGIMPIFALANAGVDLRGVDWTDSASAGVIVGVVLGLVFGKLIGVVAASAITVRLGLAARPRGVTWRGVTLVGVVAGIGFTMAIFIANLAFPAGPMLGAAKIGVLIASAISGVSALIAGRFLLPPVPVDGSIATTAHEAEGSTEL